MLPARFAPALFGFILSGLMSLVVSGVSTVRVLSRDANFLELWMGAWLMAWLIACPLVLLVTPITRRIVQRLVSTSAQAEHSRPLESGPL
ncbi:MAG: DUF2798 domain-containing protein [Rhodoferax sp.]|nr:DUF2798 domain-containing protein [Rhodoferax sp.]